MLVRCSHSDLPPCSVAKLLSTTPAAWQVADTAPALKPVATPFGLSERCSYNRCQMACLVSSNRTASCAHSGTDTRKWSSFGGFVSANGNKSALSKLMKLISFSSFRSSWDIHLTFVLGANTEPNHGRRLRVSSERRKEQWPAWQRDTRQRAEY